MTASFINQQYKLLGRIIMHTSIYYTLITPFKSKENKYNYVYQNKYNACALSGVMRNINQRYEHESRDHIKIIP